MKAEKHLALWGDSALTACVAAEELNQPSIGRKPIFHVTVMKRKQAKLV